MSKTSAFFYLSTQKIPQFAAGIKTLFISFTGEGGIRTHGRDKPYTAFPRLLLKPLGHLSWPSFDPRKSIVPDAKSYQNPRRIQSQISEKIRTKMGATRLV